MRFKAVGLNREKLELPTYLNHPRYQRDNDLRAVQFFLFWGYAS